ncbi:MAG TPA: hypothetical protein VNW71_05140 [Thermoanaerobaculia bacterium]|nr:hypothetical protein [Thermoanaerobaculia bacterium]
MGTGPREEAVGGGISRVERLAAGHHQPVAVDLREALGSELEVRLLIRQRNQTRLSRRRLDWHRQQVAQPGQAGRHGPPILPGHDLAAVQGGAVALQGQVQPGGDARRLGGPRRRLVLDELVESLGALLAEPALPLAMDGMRGDPGEDDEEKHSDVEEPGGAAGIE